MRDHLVRIGVLGQIGRFRSADGGTHHRGASVICRTNRGLEFGEVLNCVDSDQSEKLGTVLRRATPEDHLLWGRLQKNRLAASSECESVLASRSDQYPGISFMDVELLFDGKTLFFYFLGDISEEVASKLELLTDDLATAYEARVKLRSFADALITGCGPDCGTAEACGSKGGCSGCALVDSCSH